MLITEETKNLLKSIINEELSINNEVNLKTNEIYAFIKSRLQTIKYTLIGKDVSFGILSTKHDIFGISFTVKLNAYNTNNKNTFKQMCDEHDCYNAYTDFNNNIIILNIGILSGSKYKNFEGILQHEVEHIFQYIKKDKNLNTKISQNLYNKAFRILKDSDNYTKYQFYCAYLIYTLSDNEVDAFVNQLYKDLINKGSINNNQIIYTSTVMQNYQNSKKILDKFDLNNNFYVIALNSFGINTTKKQQQFINYCEKSLNRMIKKIGKVIVKAEKDWLEKKDIAVQLNNLKINF